MKTLDPALFGWSCHARDRIAFERAYRKFWEKRGLPVPAPDFNPPRAWRLRDGVLRLTM